MTSESVLQQSDVLQSFLIETDINKWVIDCSLLQINSEDGKLHLIVYNDQKLTETELNYFIHKKKLLKIKYAL